LRKITRVSLAMVFTPLLFTGCMQEKISTIIPSNNLPLTVMEDNTTLLNSTEISQPLLTINSDNNYSNPILTNMSFLDTLALSIQNATPIESVTVESLNKEEKSDWSIFSKADEILETAKEFLGVKYIWAASGPSAFDCSGFTSYVYKKNGVTLPRNSRSQARVGISIDFDDLEKGDLVFFDTSKASTGKVNHVGIYLGNNKFIHASSGGDKVMITSFSKKKFYKHRFLHGQRIIDPS
jgi:cell wall-associated NlpC family hydrolase